MGRGDEIDYKALEAQMALVETALADAGFDDLPWRTAQTLFVISTLPSELSTWELGNALGLAGEAIRMQVKSLLAGGYVLRADDETIVLTELGREAARVFAAARYGATPPDWANG